MTVLTQWYAPQRESVEYDVSGCFRASVTRYEVAAARDYADVVTAKLTPLVWLAMPVHDEDGHIRVDGGYGPFDPDR